MRVLGVVFGAIFPIILLQATCTGPPIRHPHLTMSILSLSQLTSTNVVAMTIIMTVWVFFCNYVRCAGGKHNYAGLVASFVVVEVLLMNKNGVAVTHTVVDDFQMVQVIVRSRST